jgi:signal transduction protein with GAF and PtsI domain
MTSGLLAPLCPPQEIALRRIAHGSLIVDAQVVARLMALGLVQQTNRGHRLTPLGQLRYDELPKAPLLTRQRSIHAVTGYVEGIIEKAQARAHAKALDAKINGAASARSMPVGSDEVDDADSDVDAAPALLLFDSELYQSRARAALGNVRRQMKEHRQRQILLRDASLQCIDLSRSLLKHTMPIRPAWLTALQ